MSRWAWGGGNGAPVFRPCRSPCDSVRYRLPHSPTLKIMRTLSVPCLIALVVALFTVHSGSCWDDCYGKPRHLIILATSVPINHAASCHLAPHPFTVVVVSPRVPPPRDTRLPRPFLPWFHLCRDCDTIIHRPARSCGCFF